MTAVPASGGSDSRVRPRQPKKQSTSARFSVPRLGGCKFIVETMGFCVMTWLVPVSMFSRAARFDIPSRVFV